MAQVLLDGEIEVERRLLEHDAERPERLGDSFRRRAAGDLDPPGWGIEQPGDSTRTAWSCWCR